MMGVFKEMDIEIQNWDRFVYWQDPGHGWVEVPIKLLSELGIVENISSYSYLKRRGRAAYLEEDCDAGVFMTAYADKYGKQPKFMEQYIEDGSRIRNLPNYDSALVSEWREVIDD